MTQTQQRAPPSPEKLRAAASGARFTGALGIALGVWQLSAVRASQFGECRVAMEFVLVSGVSHLLAGLGSVVVASRLERDAADAQRLLRRLALVMMLRMAAILWGVILFFQLAPRGNACRHEWEARNAQVWPIVLVEFILFCLNFLFNVCNASRRKSEAAAQQQRQLQQQQEQQPQQPRVSDVEAPPPYADAPPPYADAPPPYAAVGKQLVP